LTGFHYIDKIVETAVHPYSGSVDKAFVLLDGNASPHRAWVGGQ